MQGFQYNIALTVFYIFVRRQSISLKAVDKSKRLNLLKFMCSEIPSNLALKHFGNIFLAFTIVAFGIITIGTAFIKSYQGLIITRVFLGIAEGGTSV